MKVFRDKTTDEVEEKDNEAVRIGNDLEQYVAGRFMEATGFKVRRSNYMYRSKSYGASAILHAPSPLSVSSHT